MPNKLYTFKKYKLKVLMNTYPLESQPRYFMSFVGRNFQKQSQCPCILYSRTQGIISRLLPLLNSLYFLQFYIKEDNKTVFLHLKSLKEYFNRPY